MTYHTGRAAGTDGKTAVQYRHIENPYGNVFEFIDGINFSDGTVYVCLNPASYADDTANNYTNIGTKIQNNGYISAIGVAAAMPWAFYPTAVGGSETTYIPDYAYYYSGWRVSTSVSAGADRRRLCRPFLLPRVQLVFRHVLLRRRATPFPPLMGDRGPQPPELSRLHYLAA